MDLEQQPDQSIELMQPATRFVETGGCLDVIIST